MKMSSFQRVRVLIVDDDHYVGKAMTRLLRRFAEPVVASSVDEAEQRICDSADFALILCDLLLPDRNGIELLKSVRTTHPELAERIAFMTGLGDDAEEASEYPDVPCLGKPVNVNRIRELLGVDAESA